jgi:hypothetical protein
MAKRHHSGCLARHSECHDEESTRCPGRMWKLTAFRRGAAVLVHPRSRANTQINAHLRAFVNRKAIRFNNITEGEPSTRTGCGAGQMHNRAASDPTTKLPPGFLQIAPG